MTGHRSTEDHIAAPDERRQHGTPRPLHEGIDGQPVLARCLREPRTERVVDRDLGCHGVLRGTLPSGNQGRLRQAFQTPTPRCVQCVPVQAGKPPQEVGVVRGNRQAGGALVVEVDQFAQHDRGRPSVGHEMVRIEDQLCPRPGKPEHMCR